MNRTPLALALSLSLAAPAALAAEPAAAPVPAPSAAAVKSTWDYFYKGKGQGPVLVELKLCTEVGKDGPQRFECTQEVPAEGVKAGTPVMVWQSYLVPQGDVVDDITVQVRQPSPTSFTSFVSRTVLPWRTCTVMSSTTSPWGTR